MADFRIQYNPATGGYDIVSKRDGELLRANMRRASEALPPPGPRKASMSEDIRALRERIEQLTGKPEPVTADPDALIVGKLRRVRMRQLHGNRARAMFGRKPTKTEAEEMERQRTALGWLLAVVGVAFALAIAAPGKRVNQEANILLTPPPASRMVALPNQGVTHAQD